MEWHQFDFFSRVSNRLAQEIKTPFKLEGIFRVDDTPVHKAVREALANTLIHANYYDLRGVVIHRSLGEISYANPGVMRISVSDALTGGISDPRNVVLVKLFNLINIGERAGSGIPSIYSTWKEQGWKDPELKVQYNPDRTILTLTMLSTSDTIMESAIEPVESAIEPVEPAIEPMEPAIGAQNVEQVILEYLKNNKSCKASDMYELLNLKPSRVREYLTQLVSDGIIEAEGVNRYRTYRLKSW